MAADSLRSEDVRRGVLTPEQNVCLGRFVSAFAESGRCATRQAALAGRSALRAVPAPESWNPPD